MIFCQIQTFRRGFLQNCKDRKQIYQYPLNYEFDYVITDTGAEPEVIAEIVKNFGDVSATRNGCYVYTCKCHSPNKKEVGKNIRASFTAAYFEQNVQKFKGYLYQTPKYFMNQLDIDSS